MIVLNPNVGTIINPDKTHVDIILKGLENLNGFCPCVPKYAHNNDTKCPCVKYREHNECCCGLYIKKD